MSKSKKCATPRCGNTPRKHHKKCNTCETRTYRQNHPIKYAYYALRDNAKRRGKTFTLTLKQFTEFAIKTHYLDKSGRDAESFHIDRIDESGPYSIENIQVLSNRENGRKYRVWAGRNEHGENVFKTQMDTHNELVDAPF